MLIDTYAWIEFFQGTPKGKKLEALILSKKCFTSILSFAEVSKWCVRSKLDSKVFIDKIKAFSTILDLNENIAVSAGALSQRYRKREKAWGMIDALIYLIYSTALFYGLRVLTGDPDFEGPPNSEML